MLSLFFGSCYHQTEATRSARLVAMRMMRNIGRQGSVKRHGVLPLAEGRKGMCEEVTPEHGGVGARGMFQFTRSWICHMVLPKACRS